MPRQLHSTITNFIYNIIRESGTLYTYKIHLMVNTVQSVVSTPNEQSTVR